MNERGFITTSWSNVLAAGQTDHPRSGEALARLAAAYWYPLYAFARRRGQTDADARDLTQSFFARLIQRHVLARASKDRGRFRNFLLGSFKRHLAQTHRDATAVKRGGPLPPLPLDVIGADRRYALEPVEPRTPEALFERRWAMIILEESLEGLRAEYTDRGRAEVWERLHPCLEGGSDHDSYADIAAVLGMSEENVKVTIHRMRRRLRELVRQRLGGLVANAAELEEEFRHWVRILSSGPL